MLNDSEHIIFGVMFSFFVELVTFYVRYFNTNNLV